MVEKNITRFEGVVPEKKVGKEQELTNIFTVTRVISVNKTFYIHFFWYSVVLYQTFVETKEIEQKDANSALQPTPVQNWMHLL